MVDVFNVQLVPVNVTLCPELDVAFVQSPYVTLPQAVHVLTARYFTTVVPTLVAEVNPAAGILLFV